MRYKTGDLINYFARGFAIAGIGFISIFSLDVFTEYPFGPEVFLAWFMHMIPSFILMVALWVAWGSPLWGGLGFVVLGLLPGTLLSQNEDWVNFLLGAPFLVCGALFISVYVIERFNAPQ
ncbi:MAG: hypothetical protein H6873_09835 [Hyphomicrobiaceae bacterium]|nr:hypothetical protein [Hyphomicrobiaceae bacterium]